MFDIKERPTTSFKNLLETSVNYQQRVISLVFKIIIDVMYLF